MKRIRISNETLKFFKAQKTAEVEGPKRTLALIRSMESGSSSDMSFLGRKHMEFFENIAPRSRAITALLGINDQSKLSRTRIDPRLISASDSIPSVTALFTPFGLSLCLGASIGKLPSLGALFMGGLAAACFRSTLVASNISTIDSRESESLKPYYVFNDKELRIIQITSALTGTCLISSIVYPPYAVFGIPAIALIAKVSNKNSFSGIGSICLASTVGAPLGILTSPYLMELSLSYILQLQGLMWVGTAAAAAVMRYKSENLLLSGISALGIWGAFAIGGLHKSFLVFGIPASLALFAQTSHNAFNRKYERVQDCQQTLKNKEIALCLALFLGFFAGRSYSNMQGLVTRQTTVVVGSFEDETQSL